MIVVTGGAGFVGSNLVHALNQRGESDILVVDNLGKSGPDKPGDKPEAGPHLSTKKFLNLDGACFTDYMDKREFRRAIEDGHINGSDIRVIFHQGACSNTLEDDGRYMMDNNFTYSKELLHFALAHAIPFVYASTAAVYGLSESFQEVPRNEHPLNLYGFSKLAFDNYVRTLLPRIDSTVVGLRYFNVYGPREAHKGRMASVIHHFAAQLRATGTIRMFRGSGGYADGEQRRDFVFVRDLAEMNLFFAGFDDDQPLPIRAIVNAGTGESRAFQDVARALFAIHGPGKIEYIAFPEDLNNRYQHFTEADTSGLRSTGYRRPFTSLEDGVRETFAIEPALASSPR